MSRSSEPGYEEIYKHDKRRGVWLRTVCDAATMLPARIDLCSGRDGNDQHVTIEIGQVVTPEMIYKLADVVRYGKDAKASFDPPYGICDECGKTIPLSGDT